MILDGQGAPLSAQEVEKLHQNDDVDVRRESHHHTLGRRSTQASPGNHVHDGQDSELIPVTSIDWGGEDNPLSDTGVVDLSSYLEAGFTGTLVGRRIGAMAEISGDIGGSFPSNAATSFVSSTPLPSEWRPTGLNRWGAAYSGAYSLNALIRPDGTLAVGNRVGTTVTTPQFSIFYFV